jgi:hypothetical protein
MSRLCVGGDPLSAPAAIGVARPSPELHLRSRGRERQPGRALARCRSAAPRVYPSSLATDWRSTPGQAKVGLRGSVHPDRSPG